MMMQDGEEQKSDFIPEEDQEAPVENQSELRAEVHQQGLDAPIVLALSTVCNSPPHVGLRASLLALPQTDPRFKVGPDTDQVQSRRDGCHWDAAGRQQVAQAWADKLYPLLAQLSQHRPL